jgi:hypothetical protein
MFSDLYQRVVQRPDDWSSVQQRNNCFGVVQNDSLSWMGPTLFSQYYQVTG